MQSALSKVYFLPSIISTSGNNQMDYLVEGWRNKLNEYIQKFNTLFIIVIYVQINQIVDEHLKNKYFQPREYRNPYQSFGGYRTGLHILCSILPLWELSSWCKTLPLHETVSLF